MVESIIVHDGECPVCHVRRHYRGLELANVPDEPPRHRHSGHWCETVANESYDEVRRKIEFGPLLCRVTCTLPLDWDEETRGLARTEEGSCENMDMVLLVGVASTDEWSECTRIVGGGD